MEAKPWYLSRTTIALIFSVLGGIGPLNQWLASHGYVNVFDSASVDATLAAVGSIVSAVSALVALHRRVTQPLQGPVTLTAASADAKNADTLT